MTPDPRYWPKDTWNTNNGMPKKMESSRNCRIKVTPKSMVRMANLEILNMPKVHVKAAKTKLKL